MSTEDGSVLKWVDIAHPKRSSYMQILSEALTQAGCRNQLEEIEILDETDPKSLIETVLAKYNQVRLGPPYSHLVRTFLKTSELFFRQLGVADCLIHQGGQWWPRSCLYEGLKMALKAYGEKLDLGSSVLVVGSGVAARSSIVALTQAGFKKVNISCRNPESGRKLIEFLQNYFFGIEFEFIHKDNLVSLPGVNSVVVNATPCVEDNELLKELCYLNFLKREGLVIELNLAPVKTPLVIEAEQVGAYALYGYEIASWADAIWAQWIARVHINRVAYAERLAQLFDLPEDL